MIDEATQASIGPGVSAAIAEDVGAGDLTASLIDAEAVVGAQVVAHERLVVCGEGWFNEVYRQLDDSIIVDWYIGDGGVAETDDIICKLVGNARALLTGERTALNFLQLLSATATTTAAWAKAIEGTGARLLDTRKTIPGLRLAQQHAVRCGGGYNDHTGLFDAIQITGNHIKAAGGIGPALRAAGEGQGETTIAIEIESYEQLREALDTGAQRIFLKDFSPGDLRRAVAANLEYGYVAAELVASGDVMDDMVREIAETGVDYISTGAITGNIDTVDLSMRFRID